MSHLLPPAAAIPPASILIVDDMPDKHLVFRSILADLGEPIVSARSGREALARVLDVEAPAAAGTGVAPTEPTRPPEARRCGLFRPCRKSVPQARTALAFMTNSPLESMAGMLSDVAVPGPCTRPPSAKPRKDPMEDRKPPPPKRLPSPLNMPPPPNRPFIQEPKPLNRPSLPKRMLPRPLRMPPGSRLRRWAPSLCWSSCTP